MIIDSQNLIVSVKSSHNDDYKSGCLDECRITVVMSDILKTPNNSGSGSKNHTDCECYTVCPNVATRTNFLDKYSREYIHEYILTKGEKFQGVGG